MVFAHPPTLVERYLSYIRDGNRQQATALLLGALEQGSSLADIGVDIVQPAMYRIGELWEQGIISVAEEHLATAVSRHALAVAVSAYRYAPANGRRALFACVEGNHHALGLRIVCDVFESSGWECYCLGGDTPLDALLDIAQRLHPDLIGLSVSLTSQLESLLAAIEAIDRLFHGRSPEILVGGQALNGVDIGAIGLSVRFFDNARSALEHYRT